jgi:hypothetical protein
MKRLSALRKSVSASMKGSLRMVFIKLHPKRLKVLFLIPVINLSLLTHLIADPEIKPSPKYTYTRARKDGDKAGQHDDWKREAENKDAWGTGEAGYKRPKEASDRLRYVLIVV